MRIQMIGNKYDKLTVVSECGKDHRGYRYSCECECGGTAINVAGVDLRSGHKTSCGCNLGNRRRTHGMFGTEPYNAWSNMKRRCNDKNGQDYFRYGGRGITYCDEWESFEEFWEDMKDGYLPGLTLDRIDVNGNYCKDNCRWATFKMQQNNKRNNHIVEYYGKTYTLSELSDATGKNYSSILTRLRSGFSAKEAVELPPIEKETIEFNGVIKTVSEYAKERGMSYYQLKKRLVRGWTIERALTQPLRKRA